MRWALPLVALFFLTRCGGMTDYDPNRGSNSSLQGNQGSSGVQAPFWSSDPNKTTVTNQKPSQ
jgi:hypothetical protein